MRRDVALVLAAIVASASGGIDGAHPTLFDEQSTPGRLQDHASDALPVGVDIAGVLVPAVLKVGHLLNRGFSTNAHYGDVHSWIINVLKYCRWATAAAKLAAAKVSKFNQATPDRQEPGHTPRSPSTHAFAPRGKHQRSRQ